jgi:hypothetical protein
VKTSPDEGSVLLELYRDLTNQLEEKQEEKTDGINQATTNQVF